MGNAGKRVADGKWGSLFTGSTFIGEKEAITRTQSQSQQAIKCNRGST